jgi:hypothetical protein
MIISRSNGCVWRLSFTLNVQLCACEALPPLPPTDVFVEPVSTSVLSVSWQTPDDRNGRVITAFVIICNNVEDSYVPHNGVDIDYDNVLIEDLKTSGAEYVIQIISVGPLHNSSAAIVTQRTSKWQ